MFDPHQRKFKGLLSIETANALRRAFYGLYGLGGRIGSPLGHIFILGHMRAGSTLLSNLLFNNPAILGLGELHLIYRSRWDLNTMTGRLLFSQKRLFRNTDERYMLDKMLHNYQLTLDNLELVRQNNVKVIVLFREPQAALRSIVRTFKDRSLEFATEYYDARLNLLTQIMEQLGSTYPILGIEYDHIIDAQQEVFTLVEDYLGLKTPLTAEYETHDWSGKGDPSANLKSGRILKQTAKAGPQIEIPAESLRVVNAAYHKGQEAMRTYCRTINLANIAAKTDTN